MCKFNAPEISKVVQQLLTRMLQADRVLADMKKTADRINKKYKKPG